MRAAVYRGPGRMVLEEIPVPEIGPGELLVRVRACGVCGTDLKKIEYGLAPPPRVFGHETTGEVAAVGPGETEWQPGDRVAVHHHVPCRECFYCRQRAYASCPGYRRTGATAGWEPAGGGFAEYVRVMSHCRPGVVRVPDDVPLEEASFLEPLNTVLKGASTAAAAEGETALVIGQGPIGLLFTQVLRLRGCGVIASDPLPSRRDLAARFGAEPHDPAAGDAAGPCRAATAGRGADLAVLAAPRPELVSAGLAALRPGGRLLLFAQTRMGEPLTLDAGEVGVQEKRLIGSYSADIDLQREAADLLFGRKVQVAPLITHRLPLERIEEALATAARPAPGSLKVLVCP